MEKVWTIGLDIAKQVFQVDGINAAGKIAVRRKLHRTMSSAFGRLPSALPRSKLARGAIIGRENWPLSATMSV